MAKCELGLLELIRDKAVPRLHHKVSLPDVSKPEIIIPTSMQAIDTQLGDHTDRLQCSAYTGGFQNVSYAQLVERVEDFLSTIYRNTHSHDASRALEGIDLLTYGGLPQSKVGKLIVVVAYQATHLGPGIFSYTHTPSTNTHQWESSQRSGRYDTTSHLKIRQLIK